MIARAKDSGSAAPAGRTAIISDKQLGDVTLLEPATRLLAAQSGLPAALHVKGSFRPLVELMPDAVWGPDLNERCSRAWATSWSSRVAMQAWRIRAQKRCLLVNQKRHLRWWYRLVFHHIQVTPLRGGEYWAHYFWRALGGAPEAFRSPTLRQPPESWRHPQLPERPYVLINPTAAWPTKFWNAESWARVIASAGIQLPWVMTGGGSPIEREHCAAVAAAAPPGLVNLAGETTLKQYLHALSRARLVLCVDGSSSHLAQAFDVPAITLFGPVYEVKWTWPTPRHRALSAYRLSDVRPATTANISVEATLAELAALLAEFPEIAAAD